MMPAFEGTVLVSLDAKGRFAVPALFRDALSDFGAACGKAASAEAAAQVGEKDARLVLTRHPDGCLVLYPYAVWLEKRAQLASLPYSARAFVRLVLGSARTVTPDAAGRILVPADLRALAGIERAAALIGLGSHLELWSRAGYEALEAEALQCPPDAANFTF